MDQQTDINPILDISEHYVPLDLSKLFGNNRDFALEVGFGDGDFLIETAMKNPEKNFLGIEVKIKRFNKAVKKALAQKVENIKFLHMDANIAVEELFHPDSFSVVYINFPDPWPKDRHEKHRIVNREFLEKLSGIMKNDAQLDIASDHKDYVFNALETFKEIKFFTSEYAEPGFVQNIPGRPQTRYEREFRKEGREIYYLIFTNNK